MKFHPVRRLEGELAVPGDKGIAQRAILLAAGVDGKTVIRGLPTGGDVLSALGAVEILGRRPIPGPKALVETSEPGSRGLGFLELEGKTRWRSLEPSGPVDCRNSGTTMRLLMGILAGSVDSAILIGDESLSRRPMGRVRDPLRQMGAEIDLSADGTAPVRIRGRRLTAIDYVAPIASAQVKSAILLAGTQADGTTTVLETTQTRDHTERMLAFLGAPVEVTPKGVSIKEIDLFGDKEIDIPGDFSSASYLLAAAAILEGSDVTIRGVGLNPTRIAFLEVLSRYGALVETSGAVEVSGEPRGTVRIRAAGRRPPEISPAQVPSLIDELPLVAVLAAYAEGDTEVRGAAELRVKESDRIAAIVEGLRELGVRTRELPDGFAVHGGGRPGGGTVTAGGDHRIALALAVAALGAGAETEIDDWRAADVTYPAFAADLERLIVP